MENNNLKSTETGERFNMEQLLELLEDEDEKVVSVDKVC